MPSYAQTYPQLFNQLRGLDYSKADLSFIRDAYEMAMVLFSGRFQPSGKLFMAHVVGTASILASVRSPVEVIAAGLLHNAYANGDFGDGRRWPTTRRQEQIRKILGTEVEEYVSRFPSMWWYSPKIQVARRDLRTLEAVDRNVLLICIADELEHLCDLDLLYYSDEERRAYLECVYSAAEWAELLNLSSISAEFDEKFREIKTGELPVRLSQQKRVGSFVCVPKSQTERFAVKLKQELLYQRTRVYSRISHIRRQIDRIQINSDLRSVLCDGGSLERVARGFQFTEGPVWIPDDKSLLFSDIPANVIFRLKADGSLEIYRHPSGNSNGLTRDRHGRLISCEHGHRRVARTEKDGSVTVVANEFRGNKLNSPNDVVVRSDGAVYFTDPAYGISPHQQEQPVEGVYRVSPDGKEISLVAADFKRPNGLAFSPDEKILYIDDSARRHIRAFKVMSDGSLSEGFVFHDMNDKVEGAPDGMKIDAEGRIYCTGARGVWVFNARGKHLGIIPIPEKPSNCAWGDEDLRTLFITAVSSVYKIRVRTPGIKV